MDKFAKIMACTAGMVFLGIVFMPYALYQRNADKLARMTAGWVESQTNSVSIQAGDVTLSTSNVWTYILPGLEWDGTTISMRCQFCGKTNRFRQKVK